MACAVAAGIAGAVAEGGGGVEDEVELDAEDGFACPSDKAGAAASRSRTRIGSNGVRRMPALFCAQALERVA